MNIPQKVTIRFERGKKPKVLFDIVDLEKIYDVEYCEVSYYLDDNDQLSEEPKLLNG